MIPSPGPRDVHVIADACCLETASARRLDGPDRKREALPHTSVLYISYKADTAHRTSLFAPPSRRKEYICGFSDEHALSIRELILTYDAD